MWEKENNSVLDAFKRNLLVCKPSVIIREENSASEYILLKEKHIIEALND
jgi:hypothetical protein